MRWPVVAGGVLLASVALALVGYMAASPRGEPAPAPGQPAPAPGRVTVPAPIDRVEVVIRESAPPQVSVRITAGLPSGCAQRGTHSVGRTGDRFVVRVLNSMPQGDPPCTAIYGTYQLSVELVGDFRPGVTYTVEVNDKITTFKT